MDYARFNVAENLGLKLNHTMARSRYHKLSKMALQIADSE